MASQSRYGSQDQERAGSTWCCQSRVEEQDGDEDGRPAGRAPQPGEQQHIGEGHGHDAEVHQEEPGSGVGGRHRLTAEVRQEQAARDQGCGRDGRGGHGHGGHGGHRGHRERVVPSGQCCPDMGGHRVRRPRPDGGDDAEGSVRRLVTARQAHACQPEWSGCHRDDLTGRGCPPSSNADEDEQKHGGEQVSRPLAGSHAKVGGGPSIPCERANH
ncbi:MAG: hypothetical protein JWP24_1625 [Marmoricola sp.]|nr:hypothetical protein [Marmoricola sp.]